MEELKSIYADIKSRAGKLDFVDLLILARDLVARRSGGPALSAGALQPHLRGRIPGYRSAAGGDFAAAGRRRSGRNRLAGAPRRSPGKLFVVGDPKQSIYKFRRADVLLYQQVREALRDPRRRPGALTKSFRAVRPIQECVNAAFAPEMSGDAAAGPGRVCAARTHRHETAPASPRSSRCPRRGRTHRSESRQEAINACLPDTIVAFVDWLVNESGWKVRDAEDRKELVPVGARAMSACSSGDSSTGAQDLTRDYVRGFEARNVPHLLVGSKSFHKREEVETLRAALSCHRVAG